MSLFRISFSIFCGLLSCCPIAGQTRVANTSIALPADLPSGNYSVQNAFQLDYYPDRFADTQLPMVYCNLVGGQDELVFDGRSMLVDGDGARAIRARQTHAELLGAR